MNTLVTFTQSDVSQRVRESADRATTDARYEAGQKATWLRQDFADTQQERIALLC